jgi:Glycosyltransferase family 87
MLGPVDNGAVTAFRPSASSALPGSVLHRQLAGRVGVALDIIGVGLIALFLAGFVERNLIHQSDLKTYQLAAAAVLNGLDPYAPENLASLAGRRVFPFVYPPGALALFVAAASVPAKTFAAWWMWGKVAVLGVLVVAWSKWFSRNATMLSMALVATFGWNSSAQWDLAAGNVAILECGLVWAAFACYVAGGRMRFALLMIAAACFKLAPAALLLLLLVPTSNAPASPKQFAIALSILVLVILGPTLFGPAAHYQRFWAHVPDATGYGVTNPSALGFAALAVQWAGLRGTVAEHAASAVWIAYVAGLIACSAPLLRYAHRCRDPRRWVMTAVFLYVLLLPRPMAYGFLVLAPAPLFFSPKPFDSAPGRLFLGLVLAAQGLWRMTSNGSDSPLVTYAPFLLSLCVWLLILNEHLVATRSAHNDGRERKGVPPVPVESAA